MFGWRSALGSGTIKEGKISRSCSADLVEVPMDSESERLLLDRLKTLEEQVARLVRDVKVPDTPEMTTNQVIETLERIHAPSLVRVLREIPKERWAQTFFGLPRKSMEKLKASVSKNSWAELVEDWTISHYGLARQLDHQQLLRVISQLEQMGEILLDSLPGSDPEAFFNATVPFDADTYRARWAEADRKAAAETKLWMDRELSGLI
jgi:hypothetical protein